MSGLPAAARRPMRHTTGPTAREMVPFVRTIWTYASEPDHRWERLLPRTGAQLLVNLERPALRSYAEDGAVRSITGPVAIQGASTRPVVIDARQKRDICGVEFTPAGLSAFTDRPATLFRDALVDANEVWGDDVLALRTSLSEAGTPRDRCDLLEAFLLARHVPREEEDALLERLLSDLAGGARVGDVRERTGLSQRRLHALFDRRVGIRPKLFAQISRVSASLSRFAGARSLAALSAEGGFADQAHFNREFRRFTGSSPGAHEPIESEPNHAKPAADDSFKTGGDGSP